MSKRGRGKGKLRRPHPSRLHYVTNRRTVADISGDLRSGATATTTSGSSTATTASVAGSSRGRASASSKAIYYSPIAAEIGPSKKKKLKTGKPLGEDEQQGSEPEAGSSKKDYRSDKTRRIVSSSLREQPSTDEPPTKKQSKRVSFATEETRDHDKFNRFVSLRNMGNSKGKFLHSLRTVTKLKIPPPRQRTQKTVEDTTDNFDFDTDTQESLEICQGLSKIKLQDWHPFFDIEHNKRNPPDVADAPTSTGPFSSQYGCSSSCDIQGTTEDGEDDEWEETLVYVDLEDIPDVDGLLSSLAPRGAAVDDVGLSHLEMKIYDMQSKLPVLQLGGKYLAGHWENTVGTSLFFKKKAEADEDPESSPNSHSSTEPSSPSMKNDSSKLKSIVPELEIPYDPVYGENYVSGEEGYEFVAKSFKVLKARYFPVVSEVVKKEDILHDSDEEFDPRDFQIPPINMVRQYMTKDIDYEQFTEADVNRRKEIREKWLKPEKKKKKTKKSKTKPIIKSEPVEYEDTADIEVLDTHLDPFLANVNNSEHTPGTSKNI